MTKPRFQRQLPKVIINKPDSPPHKALRPEVCASLFDALERSRKYFEELNVDRQCSGKFPKAREISIAYLLLLIVDGHCGEEYGISAKGMKHLEEVITSNLSGENFILPKKKGGRPVGSTTDTRIQLKNAKRALSEMQD